MLTPNSDREKFNLDFNDLNDFRIPVKIFKEYSVVMKGLNKECQNMFLIAKGVDVTYSRSKLGWESFLSIYCLLKLNTATEKEYQDFIVKVFDPYNDKIVAKEQVEETLDAMFKG